MEETPLQMVHRLQRSRVKSCKAKAGKLTSMGANPAIQNVISFTYDAHVWKEPGITRRLCRGLFDADAKVAFNTVHTLCMPSEMVVVDKDGTCGYLVGIEPGVAPGLMPDHPVLTNGLVLPDLSNSTILLAQQPNLEVDFLGRIKKLDLELSLLSDAEVRALFGERYLAFSEVQLQCLPFQFDQSAESRRLSVQRLKLPMRGSSNSLAERELLEDMVYGQLDGDGDACDTPSSSATSTPILRPVRPTDVNLILFLAKYAPEALLPDDDLADPFQVTANTKHNREGPRSIALQDSQDRAWLPQGGESRPAGAPLENSLQHPPGSSNAPSLVQE